MTNATGTTELERFLAGQTGAEQTQGNAEAQRPVCHGCSGHGAESSSTIQFEQGSSECSESVLPANVLPNLPSLTCCTGPIGATSSTQPYDAPKAAARGPFHQTQAEQAAVSLRCPSGVYQYPSQHFRPRLNAFDALPHT